MSANLAPVIRQFFYDSNGNPLSGGKLYSYQAGTTTPQATYTDSSAGTPNANPVILDASGSANVWLNPALSYKFVLQDTNGVQQWSVDNVIGTLAAGSVVTATLQDGAVTRAKLAAGAVSNLGVVSKNAVFTAAVTDDIYLCDTSSGAYIATLPTAIGNAGKSFTFKKTTNDYNSLTIKGNGSETIDGSNTVILYSPNDSLVIVSDGSNWKVTNIKKASITAVLALATGVTPSANSNIKYDTVLWDDASGYSAATGNYTVKVPGRYNVSAVGETTGGTGFLVAKNGVQQYYLFSAPSGSITSGSASVSCVANDTISVQVAQANPVNGGTPYQNLVSIERIGD